ncbi:MAG: hypothetical protein AB1757_04535 [Acidobacteriota bacterium]
MRIFAIQANCLLAILLAFLPAQAIHRQATTPTTPTATSPSAKQLYAVRGEVVKKTIATKGWLQITIRPLKETSTVVIFARENDLVGNGVRRSSDTNFLGLLSEDEDPGEPLTAAELDEGDFVSVIYDPQQQNRAIEIYIH